MGRGLLKISHLNFKPIDCRDDSQQGDFNMNIKIDKRIFNDVYYPYLLDYSHRYEVYYGGRGSGKTKFIFQKLLVKGLSEKRRILCMMKTTSNIKQGIWNY